MEGAIFDCPALWLERLPPGVLGAESPAGLAGRKWDLLALTRRGRAALGRTEVSCRILLAPGDGPPPARAETVITCGLSPRDSLTLSSREGDTLWAALQRELVTVDGRVVERQEFPLRLEPGAGELPSLAAAGALLLLGVPPEELSRPGS